MSDPDWVDLDEAIGQLRAQLSDVRNASVDEELLFSVNKAEIELLVEARREAGGGGGVKFGVISIEGKGSRASSATHRIRLELTPHDRAGNSIDVGDQMANPPSR